MKSVSSFDAAALAVMLAGVIAALAPLYLIVTTASHDAVTLTLNHVPLWPGSELPANLATAWQRGALGRAMVTSLVVCALVTAAKLTLSTLTAFALVFFATPLRTIGLPLLFLTLMLPLECRIGPTYGVAADVTAPLQAIAGLAGGHFPFHLSLLDSYAGLSLPLAASATGTFLFRQIFRALPASLSEAARLDGAGPLRFLRDMVLPLSRPNLAALAVVLFLSSWNQYLWPLLITTRPALRTAVVAVATLLPDPQDPSPAWNIALAGVLIIILPPLVLVALFHRAMARGLTGAAE